MKRLAVALLAVACLACESPNDEAGHPRVTDKAVYIRDVEGRCLRLVVDISVSGTQVAQFGHLDLFVVPEVECSAKEAK